MAALLRIRATVILGIVLLNGCALGFVKLLEPEDTFLGFNSSDKYHNPPDSLGFERHHRPSESTSDSPSFENKNKPSESTSDSLSFENKNKPSDSTSDSLSFENKNKPSEPTSELSSGYESYKNRFDQSEHSYVQLRSNDKDKALQYSGNPLSVNNYYKSSNRPTGSLSFDKSGPSQPSSSPISLGNHHEPSNSEGPLLRDGISFDSKIACPVICMCKYRQDKLIDIVDCSNRGLQEIPALPLSSREIYLQNNEIHSIPCDSFKNMRRLEKLDLSQNRKLHLSSCSFANLGSSKILWLERCQLTSLPVGVFDSLRNLTELNLSGNKLSSIEPYCFTHMHNLQSLDLSKSCLSKVRNNTFHGLGSLRFLSLQGNELRYTPDTFEAEAFLGLTSLESLHLEGNQYNFPDKFMYPDRALARVPTLRHLWLDGYATPLGPGFSSLLNLSYLGFSSIKGGFCSLPTIPPGFFSHVATKEPLHLDIVKCGVNSIHPETFRPIPNIHYLDLTGNEELSMDGFERGSRGLENSNLTILNISLIVRPFPECSIVKNTTFQYLKTTKLKVLIVEYCRLVNIDPKSILQLPQTLEF